MGIHLLGADTNAAMYSGKSLSWVRETATNRPWQTWRVPIAARPAQQIVWRDVVIIDEQNNFYAVQNLTDTPITVAANRTRLKNTLRAAATISDSDADGLSDRWELVELGDITTDTLTPTQSGLPGLAAYAFALPRARFVAAQMPQLAFVNVDGQRYLQLQFRRRLGLEGQRLGYRPQLSHNGGPWTHTPADWLETTRTNPYDGTGTEIVTVRRTAPMSAETELARLQVGATQP